MRIAIFHNYIDNIGGAEMVALTLAKHLNADVYTTNIETDKIIKMGFEDVLPRIKSIGKVPAKAPFKHQLALWKFRRLKLKNQYDFYVIAGDWAMSGVVNNKPNLWYVHSPLNELWQWKDYVKKTILKKWQWPVYDMWVLMNRFLTKRYSKSVSIWVCNSQNSQNRIKKFYKKDAVVINPPIETTKYLNNKDQGYWLSVNRLISAKRIEIQVDAFKKLAASATEVTNVLNRSNERKLIIVGSYEKGVKQFEGYKGEIENKIKESGAGIKIINWATDGDLKKLYAGCRGFITTARDEDFGMTVVEAMASGKPVIAPNEGGYMESVIDNVNGILIDDIDSDKLAKSIEVIENNLKVDPDRYKTPCQDRAKMFDVDVFIEKIMLEITNHELNLTAHK